ncbi:hypothetical protein AVEN_155284-1 [Araneus ventricosus]|uniref:Uncharacterized protein n=1 Tax=Araneus ventricosus TaxID=182803 RepID=A0A4Y2D681_ARAVE|nr:hypothetical protein AVEN_155284-1 [Araneus ventricosus]
MPSLFMFRATQPPETGAMAKITQPSSGLTSLGMKIRNRHVESCVYKNVLELQNSWNMSSAHLPNWNQLWTRILSCSCIIKPLMSLNQRSPY